MRYKPIYFERYMKKESHHLNFYEIPFCPISLLYLNSNITALDCGHCFHRDCIDEVIGAKEFKCPICRKKLENSA